MTTKIKNLSGFNDRIMFIILSAPDGFPLVGPFTKNVNRNLSVVFDSLRDGFHFIERKVKDPETLQRLRMLLDDALAAYKNGERKTGAHLLQDFQDIVFPKRFKEYENRKAEMD